MDRMFKKFMSTFMNVFIDDILIHSKLDKEHKERMDRVLTTLKANTLYAKFSKCEFWLQQE